MPVRTASPELREKAKNELNELPERIEEDINHLQNWLEKQEHLNARIEDQWILNFLRASKFSMQKAKSKMDYYYTMRKLCPEFFDSRDPLLPEMQDILNRGIIVPVTTSVQPDGPVVIIFRWKYADSNKNALSDVIKIMFMVVDILLNENDNLSVAGVTSLHDLVDYPSLYILQHTPSFCKKIVLCVQNAYPVRSKAILNINAPPLVEALYGIFKPFLSEKNQNRVAYFKKTELFNYIPLSVLPKEYGGTGGCVDDITATWKKKVESYRNWFMEDSQYFADESKRVGKASLTEDDFGMEGSFRQLNFD